MTAAISGRTRVFAVVGDPVAQAGSPKLLNDAFARWGADAVLIPLQVPAAELSNILEGLLSATNVDGLCVTVPHKPAALHLVDTATDRAVRADGVNVVRREPHGGWHGDAVDGLSMLDTLRAQGFDPNGRRAWMIGAGGVGRAVAAALLEAGVAHLGVYDSDPNAVAALRERLGPSDRDYVTVAGSTPALDVELAINASPLGTHPNDPLPFAPGPLNAATIVDVALGPDPTPLITNARRYGRTTVCGHTMLARQVNHYRTFFFPEQI